MTSASPELADEADEFEAEEFESELFHRPGPAASSHPWADALERMERELHGALAKVEPIPWRPPAGLGPIPAELQERAARLLEAQLHTIRYLEDVRQTTAKHLAAVNAVPRAEIGPHPVYFDLIG